MTHPELLAPAGSFDALRAAVEAGADAVYLAGPEFNARRNAKNFTEEQLCEALLYCRERGVRTHITLNILLSDAELPAMLSYAERLATYGADALIVADPGVARLLHARMPDMELHASTQMTICNTEGVQVAAKLGFSRAVLSRELSLSDIRAVTREGGLATEVFAHGALCMCYSGQCYMSALIGRRSGNRGLCAQPCRLPYTIPGAKRVNSHPLSLRDLNLSDELKSLTDAGVSSLKLEGRMKSPAYVSAITKVYADCLADLRKPTADERSSLFEAFSRDGFTRGYFDNQRGAHMFGIRREDAPRPQYSLREGHEPPRVAVSMILSGTVGSPLCLTVSDGQHQVVRCGEPLSPAQKPFATDRLLEALCATGGTPYRAEAEIQIDPQAYVPLSAVKALRREALCELADLRRKIPVPRFCPLPEPRPAAPTQPMRYTVFVESAAQLTPGVLSLAPLRIALPLESFDKASDLPRNIPLAVVLPTVARPGEMDDIRRLARRAKEHGAEGAYISNIGMIAPAQEAGLSLWGDTGLNLFNSPAAECYADLGFSELTASFELPLSALRHMRSPVPLEAVAYGHLPAMTCENCILSNADICGSCGDSRLIDRTGAEFPVLKSYGCRSRILNAHVLWLPDRQDELLRAGISRLRLQFTTESPEEIENVVRAYLQQTGDAPKAFTRGLYFRPLE